MVRIKHRYLLVNILYPEATSSSTSASLRATDGVPSTVQFHRPTSDRVDARSLTQAIRNGITELFGDYGSGMTSASLQIKYFSPATSTAIIRVSRDHYRLVWAALTLTVRLLKPSNQPCVFQVVRVSGTIKKAEEEAIKRARDSILKAQRDGKRSPLNGAASANDASLGAPRDGDGLEREFFKGIEDLDQSEDSQDGG